MLRLHPSALDYALDDLYFVLGIGAVARLSICTDVGRAALRPGVLT